MKKTSLRRTSVMTLVVMLVSLMSVFVLPVSAKAPVNEDFLADATYSYATLSKNAYVVNTNWTDADLVEGASLNYVFRNAKKTVTYDKTKHFNTFAKAYAAFKASASNISTLVKTSPVFILNGTFTEDITVSANVMLLGNNAGISPNAELDTKTAADPMTDWAEGQRFEETVIKGTINHENSADYEAYASDSTKYKLLVDGFTLNPTGSALFNAKDSAADYNKTQTYSFYNCIINSTSGMYLFNSVSSTGNTNCFSLNNIRITENSFASLFDGSAQRIHINNLCFADNTAKILDTTITSKNLDFDMRNSYVYDNNVGYVINTYYSQTSSHISSFNIHDSIFRDAGSSAYGFATFRSNAGDSGSNYLVNLTGNTFISTTGSVQTLFNGASDIFRGAITLNLNHNRVIGYESMFPNSTAYHIEADFNYNYFQPTFDPNDTNLTDNVNGADWVRSHYSEVLVSGWLKDTSKTRETVPYVDPFDWKLIKYYSDYKLTMHDDILNVTGATFYDDVENIAIDNINNKIALVTKVNLTNLSATNGFTFASTPDKVEYFYETKKFSFSSLSYVITEHPITAINASSNNFEVCYVRATKNGVSRKFEITLNSDPTFTVPAFSSGFTCPTGELSSNAYLYMPGISGTSYTVSINGSKYSFSVGTNAFSNINDIFSKANNAKIIVGPGSHSAITITEDCELYGVNYATPASVGTGAAERYYGSSWNTTNRSTLASITVSGGTNVKISGVTVTGAVTSKAATTKIYNSDIKGGITANGITNLTVEGSRIASSSAAINGTLPATTTFKSNYVTSATKLFANGWSGTSNCTLNVKNSRFDNVTAGYLPSPTGSATHSGSALTVTDSAFMTGSAVNGVVTANPSLCAMTFTGNAFVNSASTQSKAFTTTTSFTLKENRFVGFEPGVVTDYNYYAPYSTDFMEAANGRALGNVYYIDYKLGALVSDVQLKGINIGFSGAQYGDFSNASRTVRIRLASGNAGEVTFAYTGNLPYKIYSDADCTTEVTLHQATYSAGAKYTFYMLANYQTKDRAYKIVVDCLDPAGEFTETFENETIGNNAFLLVQSTSVANGDRLTANWLGTNYHFTKGINAFTSTDDIYKTAKDRGIETPQILVPSWSGAFNLNNAGYYYAPNYNVSPYVIAGTATDGSDWAYNDAYTANKVTVGDIVIGSRATGKIGVYGFEMTGRYNDQNRDVDCPLDVRLENILVNSTSTVHGIIRCDNDCVRISDQAANLDNHDELYVKNMYIQTTKMNRFMTEFYPEHVTFDGLFFDFSNGYANGGVNYIKLTGKDAHLTFKNSNLRNFLPTSNRFNFEGNHTNVVEGITSSITWQNNILYNFRTGTDSLFPMFFEWLTHFNFENNTVLHPLDAPAYMLHSIRAYNPNYYGTAVRITDNVLLGVHPVSSIGTNNFNTEDSIISGNYTSTTGETSPTTLAVKGGASEAEIVNCINYAVSPLLDALNTDFALVKVKGKGAVVINGLNITYTILSGRVQLFEHFFGSDAITAKFYKDAECTTTVASTTNGTCYVRGEYTYPDGTILYFPEYTYTGTSTLSNVSSTKVFTEAWVDDEYITSEAMLISNTVATSTNSVYQKASWCGTQYAFVKGVNAFATVEEAYAYATANGIDNPQYLILDIGGSKGTTVISEYNFTCPGSYFTQNYNKLPYKKGTKANGSDWKTNVGTSTTSFKVANGIQINWFSFKNATIPGDYKFYGFTITGCFEDIRNTNIEMNHHLENTYFNMSGTTVYSAFYTGGTRFTTDSNSYTDSMTIKNMYFVGGSAKPFFLTTMNLWPNLEIDGLFADFKSASTTFSTTDLYQRSTNSTFIFRNSNIRNKIRENKIITRGFANAYYGKINKTLIIEDNIFYNYSSYDNTRFMTANMQYFTDFAFNRNYVCLEYMSDVELVRNTSAYNTTPTDCKMTIEGNYLNGIGSFINFNSRSPAADSFIGRNYTSPEYSVKDVGSLLTSTMVGGAEYYLDPEMTILSNEIMPMTVGGAPFDTNGMSADVEIEPDVSVVDVTGLIDSGYNKITGYLDSSFTIPTSLENFPVANAGARVYLRVSSYDGSVYQTRILNILRKDGFAVENQALGSSYNKTENETVFNWLTWRGKVTATGELTFCANENMSHRVGIIYFSSASHIDTIKQELVTELTASTIDSADTAVDAVNAKMETLGASSGIKAYVMNKNKTLVWDSVSQSYGYRYNFSVEEGFLRGAIMYVMYEDAEGNIQVSFSDLQVLRSQS